MELPSQNLALFLLLDPVQSDKLGSETAQNAYKHLHTSTDLSTYPLILYIVDASMTWHMAKSTA